MGRYVVIDLEMCRVPKRFRKTYMHSMETIQIGAAVLDENFHIEKTYSRYVKPRVGMLDSTIARLTGIEGLIYIMQTVLMLCLGIFQTGSRTSV